MSSFTLFSKKGNQLTNQIIQDFSVALRLLLGNVEHVCHNGLEESSFMLDVLEVPQSFEVKEEEQEEQEGGGMNDLVSPFWTLTTDL